ncbi:MAG: carbon-nitrogen hydrolase family protein [Planctomycetota bacterium]|jgi:predicted amidohydrolase
MPRNATISLVCYKPLPSDEPDRLKKTLQKMSEHVDQAAALKADLVAFPEVCNRLGSPAWHFEPLDGPTVTAMAAKAKQHKIHVVCPLATEEDGGRYNSSVLLGRDGRIAGVYHKNFPTLGELGQGIMPGTAAPVFETDLGRIGLCVCFDLNYWEVGSSLCANRAELVVWSSMWTGRRMMARWAIELGFYMAGVHAAAGSFVDLAGREIVSATRNASDAAGAAPLVTASLDLDRRLLHHDGNVGRLKQLFETHGPDAAHVEWIKDECLIVLGSQLPGVATDHLIEQFGLEPMRDYLARVRRDRQRALDGKYSSPQQAP